MKGKIIIISAPSGCGKSTIIGRLFERGDLNLEFSISATTRQPRGEERHGVDYYFLTEEDFRTRIAGGEFLEFEEVYPGRFYGTLRSEIDRITDQGNNIVLDIDVAGAVNVKRMFGEEAVSIFIMPPSVEALRERLVGRGTDSPEAINDRVGKAEQEIAYAPQFDHCVVNDILETAVDDVDAIIRNFIKR